jgi:hypothetical protein
MSAAAHPSMRCGNGSFGSAAVFGQARSSNLCNCEQRPMFMAFRQDARMCTNGKQAAPEQPSCTRLAYSISKGTRSESFRS